jgi:hypothetical protein
MPEGELICSFLGYVTAGMFLIYIPLWAIAFAAAFIFAEAVGTWAKLLPLVWVGAWVMLVPVAWVGLVAMAGAGTAGAVAGAGAAGALTWFVLWAVARHVAFALPRGKLGDTIRVVIFAASGAVTWFVFGSVAGRVASLLARGDVGQVVLVIVWAWAWAWAWFLFEAAAGVVVGGIGWILAGVAIGWWAGVAVWAWAAAGAVAGMIAAVVSKARKELLQSFSKWHAFLILATTTLLGLVLGRLISAVLVSQQLPF